MPSSERVPGISIVIVAWNGKRYVLECLESLRACSHTLDTEVIVVDNASTDGTPDAVRWQFPEVRLIENGSNLGFARANNIGMALSRGKYVCLVNSDVVVPPGCFENLVEFMEANERIGVLGPKMRSPDGTVGASVMRLPTPWNTFCCAIGLHRVFGGSRLFAGFEVSGYPYDATDDVEVLTGWFWVVRRVALEQVGGLDERFFMYGEDIDWCYRFRTWGWRVVFYPHAEALHYGGGSSSEAPVRFYLEMRRANAQFFRKHYSRLGVAWYQLAIWIHELLRVASYCVIYVCGGRHREAARSKIRRSVSCLRWLLGKCDDARKDVTVGAEGGRA